MRNRSYIVHIVLLGCLLSGPILAEPSFVQLVDFRIKDQFDNLHTSGYYRRSVVVLVTGDRAGSKFIEQWAPALQDSVAGLVDRYRVKFLPAAHLKGAPFFVKSKIKNKFAQKKANWILMDYEGLFKKAYDLPDEMCSLVGFDRQGERRWQKSVTTFDPVIQAEILVAIRRWAED